MINIPKGRKHPWITQSKAKSWTTDPEHKKIYDSVVWKVLRDDWLIEYPFCKCKRPATVVDHIKPIRNGGDIWNLNNLQSMCRRCHNSKTAKESNQ